MPLAPGVVRLGSDAVTAKIGEGSMGATLRCCVALILTVVILPLALVGCSSDSPTAPSQSAPRPPSFS